MGDFPSSWKRFLGRPTCVGRSLRVLLLGRVVQVPGQGWRARIWWSRDLKLVFEALINCFQEIKPSFLVSFLA